MAELPSQAVPPHSDSRPHCLNGAHTPTSAETATHDTSCLRLRRSVGGYRQTRPGPSGAFVASATCRQHHRCRSARLHPERRLVQQCRHGHRGRILWRAHHIFSIRTGSTFARMATGISLRRSHHRLRVQRSLSWYDFDFDRICLLAPDRYPLNQRSGGFEYSNRQYTRSTNLPGAPRNVTGELKLGEPADEFLDRHLKFEPGKVRTEASVDAKTEGCVPV